MICQRLASDQSQMGIIRQERSNKEAMSSSMAHDSSPKKRSMYVYNRMNLQ